MRVGAPRRVERHRKPLLLLLAALASAGSTLAACGDTTTRQQEHRLEQLEGDPVAEREVSGTRVVRRRTEIGGPSLGEHGVEVEITFEVSRSMDDVAIAFEKLAVDAGWHLSSRCGPNAILLTGTKVFDSFVGLVSMVMEHDDGRLTLTGTDHPRGPLGLPGSRNSCLDT